MSSAVRGAEEEVFETPDLAEDDPLEAEMLSTGNEPFLTGNREVPDAEVLPTQVAPRAAFEVFMGKTYAGSREDDVSDVIGTSSLGVAAGGGAVYAAEGFRREGVDDGRGGMGLRRAGESPAQRLLRLREETAMLAEDLEEMSKVTGRRPAEEGTSAAGEGLEGEQEGGGREDVGPSGYALWSAMAKETEALKRQLAQLSGNPKFKHIISSPAYTRTAEGEEALQRRLSEGIVKALEALRLKEKGGHAGAGVAEMAPAAVDPSGSAASVTYELFLEEAAEARARATAGAAQGGGFSGVERRIAALEEAVGGGGGGGIARVGFGEKGQAAPLADAVASLEKRVAVLEPGRLDAIRMKAQLAKAELDAFAKSRASVAAASGSSASATGSSVSSPSLGDAAQRKKVEEAFATLQAWQAVSDGLPALVDRLRALETLHLASASFAQRLEQLEGSQSELCGVLKSTSEELVATRESSAENVAIVEENIRALDGRLAGVGLS